MAENCVFCGNDHVVDSDCPRVEKPICKECGERHSVGSDCLSMLRGALYWTRNRLSELEEEKLELESKMGREVPHGLRVPAA